MYIYTPYFILVVLEVYVHRNRVGGVVLGCTDKRLNYLKIYFQLSNAEVYAHLCYIRVCVHRSYFEVYVQQHSNIKVYVRTSQGCSSVRTAQVYAHL